MSEIRSEYVSPDHRYHLPFSDEPTELDSDLEERLLSLRNRVDLTLLAFYENRHELVSTCLEDILGAAQWLVDDYCVDGEENDR